jgi:hypothetical protein
VPQRIYGRCLLLAGAGYRRVGCGLVVRDLRLLRLFAVLRDGAPHPDSAGEASLRDVLAAALDANREMARLAAELREENGRLREGYEQMGLREQADER